MNNRIKRYFQIASLILAGIMFLVLVLFLLCVWAMQDKRVPPDEQDGLTDSCSINCHKITVDDIVRLSSSKQFSGRIMYPKGIRMDQDVIPDETTAVKLGLQLLELNYGKEIYDEKPYRVALLDSVWVVETSLMPAANTENSQVEPDMELETIICGGVGHVEINKHTGEIYSIYHTK